MPALDFFVSDHELTNLVTTARREDLGPDHLDATTSLFIPADRWCEAAIVARAPGVVAGLAALPAMIEAYDPQIELDALAVDGAAIDPGDTVATLRGPLRSVLMLERVALNLCGHLSGVATHTAAFAQRVAHTCAKIYDTRKTLPGLRGLQKYAVACGGGGTHRMGLFDAVLVKDNHLAHVPLAQWTRALTAMADRARAEVPGLKFVMVEVDTLDQLDRALAVPRSRDSQPAGIDLILLDNMPPATLREAVTRRNAAYPDPVGPTVKLEASGGVRLDTVRAIAEAGVDRISVGALTHSSVNLDLGLDLGPPPTALPPGPTDG
ncbi:MAG: carboxylating nicotinate-nucleotide diphosphorylase [Planctomycetota bacterium]